MSIQVEISPMVVSWSIILVSMQIWIWYFFYGFDSVSIQNWIWFFLRFNCVYVHIWNWLYLYRFNYVSKKLSISMLRDTSYSLVINVCLNIFEFDCSTGSTVCLYRFKFNFTTSSTVCLYRFEFEFSTGSTVCVYIQIQSSPW